MIPIIGLIKKLKMDILVEMDRFQIKQNVLNVKSTLAIFLHLRHFEVIFNQNVVLMPI